MLTFFPDRLAGWTDGTVLFGLNLLVHSTLIVILGFGGMAVLRMRGKGARAQSLVLRLCLVAVLVVPPALLLFSAGGAKGLRVTMPVPERIAAPAPEKPDPVIAPSAPRPMPAGNVSAGEEKPVGRVGAGTTRTAVQSAAPSSAPPSYLTPVVQNPAAEENSANRITIPAFLSWSRILGGIAAIFPFAWAACSLFLILRAGAITIYINRIRRRAIPARAEEKALCDEVARELGISAPPVLRSPYVTGALLAGWLRPAILLPSAESMNIMAAREVFLHELAHLARRDPLWLHLCHLAKILIPFQPLVWFLARHIEEMSDYACDDFVVGHTGQSRPYAALLVDIAQVSRQGRLEAAAGSGFISRKFPLVRRIERILDTSYTRHIAMSANEIMSFAIIFLCAITLTGFVGFRSGSEAGAAQVSGHRPSGGHKNAGKRQIRFESMRPAAQEKASIATGSTAAPSGSENRVETVVAVLDTPSLENETAQAVPLPSTPDTTPAITEATGTILIVDAATRDTEKETENFTGALPSPVTMPKLSTDTPIVKPASQPAQKSETQVSPAPAPALFGLHSAATGRTETAAVKAGQLKITVPPETPAALRESLELGQENPVWSPSGTFIAFTGSGGNGIWAVSAHGGRPVLVYDNSGDIPAGVTSSRGNTRILCFTPGGEEITYLRYTAKTAGSVASKEAASAGSSLIPVIESINIDTGVHREIVRDASDGIWSPDGRYFAYVEGDYYGISLLDTTTGLKRKISSTGKSLCITPDGVYIVYVDWAGGQTDQLFRAPIAGGKPEQLTGEGIWWNPKCSPDGEWIMCSGGIIDVGTYSHLQAYNTQTHTVYSVFSIDGENLDIGGWSPSGDQFCYTRSRGVYENGKNIRKATIHINDFNIQGSVGQETSVSAKPAEFKLIGNYPNPFNPSTTIRFSLASEGRAELVIYNMAGQVVRGLVSRSLPPGMHSVVWDGRDGSGRPVSSGTYISRLKMEGKVESRRMTLVK